MRDARSQVSLVVALLAATLGACTDTSVPPDGGDDAEVFAIPPPALPVLPTLTPCRPGWREVPGDEGVTLCEPWPEGGRRDDCAIDEAHFPGTPGCARIGTECPADGWPTDLPAGRNVVYVSAAAAPGGDGRTQATAFASIGAAADIAPPGSVIAIAAGRYDESNVRVGASTTLWGACVAGTEVGSTSASPTFGVIFLAEDGSEARNLRVESPERLGVVSSGAPSTLADVVIHGARHFGIGNLGGELTADHVVISGMRAGRALVVQGHAVMHFVRIDEAVDLAIQIEGPSARLEADDVAVARTLSRSDGSGGVAVGSQGGAHTTLSGAVIEESGTYAFYLTDAGTTLVANDLVVRHDTRPGTLVATFPLAGAVLEVSRALFEDQQGSAFAPEGVGTRVTLADVVVRDLRERGPAGLARGIDVLQGASVVADRVLIARATDGAIAVNHVGSIADARNLVLVDTLGTLSGDFGRGLVANSGGVITVERVRIERARDIAVFAAGVGSSIDARAITVRDVLGRARLDDFGIGVWAELSGRVTLTDALVERAHLAGVGAIEGGVLTLVRATVRDTRATACAETTCPDQAGGFAIAAPFGGIVTATDFVVDGAALCGVVVGVAGGFGMPASMDLHHGAITGAPVGACVQMDGYDPERLHDDVEYRDVGVPLQATTYTLPGSVPAM